MRRTEVDNQANSGTVSRRRGRALALVAALGCGLILGMVMFFGVGRWLVVEDPLGKARAIAVLSGRMPLRAMEAAKLYREGYAPEIWLTRSAEPAATLGEMGISFAGEDSYNARVLIHEGVPAGAIRVLEPPIVNTADDQSAYAARAAVVAKTGLRAGDRHRTRGGGRFIRSAALVAHDQRCARRGARGAWPDERMGGAAAASGEMRCAAQSEIPKKRKTAYF